LIQQQNQGILSLIGATPLIQLTHIYKDSPFRIFAKLEGFNPSGSIKDRPAINMIKQAMETGKIGPDTVVIESSSGNLGIGLAQVCRYFGLRFICVVDPKTTTQNINIIKVYGAQIEMVSEPDQETGEYLPARIKRVQTLMEKIPDSFWPNQYLNEYNPSAHYEGTFPEITAELKETPNYLFGAVSTCGTIMGCANYIHNQGLETKVIAVDAVGSIIFGGEKKARLVPGMGASIKSKFLKENLLNEYVHVTDLDCVIGCQRLLRTEAILAGGSSGAVLMAFDKIKDSIPAGSSCVLIFADRGERYLDTIYSDDWVTQHFGNIEHFL
jgi:N-(2-amino-2-carboxyethyl)-L-glutamate synthase